MAPTPGQGFYRDSIPSCEKPSIDKRAILWTGKVIFSKGLPDIQRFPGYALSFTW